MASPLSADHQRELLRDLVRRVADRARRESELKSRLDAAVAAAEHDLGGEEYHADEAYKAEEVRLSAARDSARDRAAAWLTTAQATAAEEYRTSVGRARLTLDEEDTSLRARYEEARWLARSVREAGVKDAQVRWQKARHEVESRTAELNGLRAGVDATAAKWRVADAAAPPGPLAGDLRQTFDLARSASERLAGLQLPGFLSAPSLAGVALALLIVGAVPALFVVAETRAFAATVGVSLAAAFGVALWAGLWAFARHQVRRLTEEFRRATARFEVLARSTLAAGEKRAQRDERDAVVRHRDAVKALQDEYPPAIKAVRARRKQQLRVLEAKHGPEPERLRQQYDGKFAHAEDEYRAGEKAARAERDARRGRARAEFERVTADARRQFQTGLDELAGEWNPAVARLRSDLAAARAEESQYFPDWSADDWEWSEPPPRVPGAIRIGEASIDVAALPGGQPTTPGLLRVEPNVLTLPALLPFPNRCGLLLRAADRGRTEAAGVLQAVMARFLTALPPGKVRFTVVDPVGLGEAFGGFMHLADHDPALVSDKVWTEPGHIERRLTDLTAHMENVLQKYLRNQYKTIDEYNEQAGEVAEPFRVLVVHNFPAHFSPEAARRLVSVVNSGPACGVCTLVSVDTRQPLPTGFKLSDLEQGCLTLVWKQGQFARKDADYGELPLTLDRPPEPEALTRSLNRIGLAARDARRVEVAFSFVAPASEAEWWTADSRSGVTVPIGRSGATKRQEMRLGKGTSQHVLVVGKTGSGKSTLLHVLIVNLALRYSPDEVELYLIDFKKGVEFKAYAAGGLPHARVVAVESEREFGLSVLGRLDAELRRRGELFRAAGAHDVAGYRDATGQPMPRVLLVVDEFQEFFVEDDRTAQETALLLDRLVRQGRAFGLHVILGSQTLGGAYSLARSTIDQMAVRVALQSSDADAGLVLSKDNAAARLLTRPGEAIYNDAGGQVEGNDPFQVVWLSDGEREALVRRMRERAPGAPAALVFEGNAPADLRANPALSALLAGGKAPPAGTAWLGEAVAITGPTAAVFRPQGGANLLMVGPQPASALGAMAAAAVSLMAQCRGSAGEVPRLTVLDGSPADSADAGFWADLAVRLPGAFELVPRKWLGDALGKLSAEAQRRQGSDLAAAPLYLLVYGLHHFRELRRAEDDYGYARRGGDAAPTPSALFGSLLRDGPPVGVHTLAWCDTLTSLQRILDRQALREFELRVLFQMSANDSSNLIDSPIAGKLGTNRAFFLSEQQGPPEKFRPYDVPAAAWLDALARQLAGADVLV